MSTPARNASAHKTGRISRFINLLPRRSARIAVSAVCGAMFVAGCNQVGTGGLSSNLPPAGGGGLLSFVSVSMPDAIAGRTYAKVAVTGVEVQSKTNFPISPAIASGTAPLASCTVTSGSLPPGMNAALTVDPTGAGCLMSGTPSAADAGNTYQFTVQALDSNSPPRAAAQAFTMKVRPEFTVTPPAAVVGNALPAGVQGRSYGQIAGNAPAFTATTNLSATTGNGAVGAKNYCALAVTPALPSLTMTQVSGTNNCVLQGTGMLAAAGTYKVSIALTDSPIIDPETNLTAVPANTIAGASNASLNVAAPLKIVAQADGVSATPPAAVQGRAYGTGAGCSGGACLPLTYVATGGLPSVETADSYLFTDTGLAAAGITCAASAPSTVAKTTCAGTAGAPGATSFSVTVDDAGNLATPGGSASGTTSTLSGLSFTVDSTLSLAVSPDPATSPAVQNRAYGTGTGCSGPGGNCVAPTYTPAGGLGSYSFSVSGTPPTGINCAANGGNTAVVCSGAASATAATSTFGVSASDVANASSPSATTSPVSKTLTVNGALTLTPPVSLQPAVSGRAFGTGTGCSPSTNCVAAVFTVSGGLGTYAANAAIVSAPGTWTCALAGSQYNCSSTSVGSGTTLSITASDGASATTPGQTTASASVPITVNPPLVLTVPSTVNDAVTGRSYGVGSGCGGSCAPLQYTLAGGLGSYGAPVLTAGPNTFNCTGTSTYLCSLATVNGSGMQTLSMAIQDSSNASTPSAIAADTSKAINILGKVTLTNANLGTTWPDAVQNRSYAGSGFTVDQFTVTGGTGAYTFLAPSGFPTGFSCVTAATTDTCSATSVGTPGSYSPQITAHDTGNASTPQSTTTSDPQSQFTATLTVEVPLAVAAPSGTPQTAVDGRGYGSNGIALNTCAGPTACLPLNFAVSGGLGGYSSSVITAPGTWSCPLVGSNYACATTSVTSGGPFPATNVAVTLTGSDTANSTTPAGTTNQVSAELTIDAPLQLASSPTLPLADGVVNRAYGSGSGCLPGPSCVALVYSASGGITPSFVQSGFPTGFACAPSSLTFTCSASSITDTANSYGPQVTLTDAGNSSTPPATPLVSPGATLVVRQQLALALSPDPTANPGVQNRAYGTGSGCLSGACQAPTFTPSGGLTPYNITSPSSGAPPAGITCSIANQGSASATASCSGTPTGTGSSGFSVSVTDTANASTPASAGVPSSTSITISSPLAIGAIALPNGLQSYPYPTNAGASTLAATGGIGAYTWVPPGGSGCSSAPTGTFPPGLAIAANTGVISGTPTTPSAATSDYTFQVCVADTNNATTPTGFALPNTGGNDLTMAILAPQAYVTELGTVEVINTQSKTSVKTDTPSTNPYAAAFSPSGRFAYVTLFDSNKLAIYDTITNLQITGSPFALDSGCGPHGVAATANYVFVACNTSGNIDVMNASSHAVTNIATDSASSGPEGVAVSPDGTRVYVTLFNENKLFAIDSSSTPAALGGTNPVTLSAAVGNEPVGIVVTTPACSGCTGLIAYIAEDNTGASADGVLVETVNNGSGDSFSFLASVPTSADGSAQPGFLAMTPDNARVYVTTQGKDTFTVIDNTLATPDKISGSPFTLVGTGTLAQGIAIPPLASGTYQAFVAESGTTSPSVLGVLNNATPPVDANTPISLTSSAPFGIATTPAPQ